MVLCLFGFGMMLFGATANLYYGYCVAGAIIFSLYIVFGVYANGDTLCVMYWICIYTWCNLVCSWPICGQSVLLASPSLGFTLVGLHSCQHAFKYAHLCLNASLCTHVFQCITMHTYVSMHHYWAPACAWVMAQCMISVRGLSRAKGYCLVFIWIMVVLLRTLFGSCFASCLVYTRVSLSLSRVLVPALAF